METLAISLDIDIGSDYALSMVNRFDRHQKLTFRKTILDRYLK